MAWLLGKLDAIAIATSRKLDNTMDQWMIERVQISTNIWDFDGTGQQPYLTCTVFFRKDKDLLAASGSFSKWKLP